MAATLEVASVSNQSDGTSERSPSPASRIECAIRGSFGPWLAAQGCSIIASTYQAGKVALIGCHGQQVGLLMRHFDKPMGLAIDGLRMALATRDTILEFANAPHLAADYLPQSAQVYDGLYLPRVAHFTGDLNVHDLAYASDGIFLVNTRYSCIAKLSSNYSFEPTWRPPFISDLVPEDRCHLNGLAIRDGIPRYVTAFASTDTVGGWRPIKATGGLLIDIPSNEAICSGLCMPHSPRWHNERLYVLNSGAGELCTVDLVTGKLSAIVKLPGYLRGLAFVSSFAVVGLSRIREQHIFGGLPVCESVDRLLCGIAVVDIEKCLTLGLFEFTSGCEELFEVACIPNFKRVAIVNTDAPETQDAFTHPESSWWLQREKRIPDTDIDIRGEGQHASRTVRTSASLECHRS